jgi:hypothetical protein
MQGNARQLDGNIDRVSAGKYFVRAAERKILRVTSESVVPTESNGLTSMGSFKFSPAIQTNGRNEVRVGRIIDGVSSKTFLACAARLNRKFGTVHARHG